MLILRHRKGDLTFRRRWTSALAMQRSRVHFVERSLASLREVSKILDAKAPDDAAGFKAWLRGISQKVAEASAEGGFLGVGGVQVSDAEKATLADISKALGTSA